MYAVGSILIKLLLIWPALKYIKERFQRYLLIIQLHVVVSPFFGLKCLGLGAQPQAVLHASNYYVRMRKDRQRERWGSKISRQRYLVRINGVQYAMINLLNNQLIYFANNLVTRLSLPPLTSESIPNVK